MANGLGDSSPLHKGVGNRSVFLGGNVRCNLWQRGFAFARPLPNNALNTEKTSFTFRLNVSSNYMTKREMKSQPELNR